MLNSREDNPMNEHFCERSRKEKYISRRKFWMEAGMGIGGLALLDLLNQDRLLAAECVARAGRKWIRRLPPSHRTLNRARNR